MTTRHLTSLLFFSVLGLTMVLPRLHAAVESVMPLQTGVAFKLSDGLLRVEFVTDQIVRIRSTQNADFSGKPSLMRVPVQEMPGAIEVKNDPASGFAEARSKKLTVRVNRATGAISYFASDGRILLAEDSVQPRSFERTEVITSVADPASMRKVVTVDGEREVADKYIQKKNRDAWNGRVNFRFADGEALYGLGFDETSDLNLRGKTKRLYQHNLRIVIPFLTSTRGYGLLFDAYSAMTFKDGPAGGSMALDVIDDLDYYFIAGPDMAGAVAGYRQLTGAAAMLPRWAFGYVQSKERYKSQDELIAVVKEFRNRKIPLDIIVQDWNYWLKGQWGGNPDPKFYPDLPAATKSLHDLKAHLMISIWPNPQKDSTAGNALHKAGYTLAGSDYVNVFKPEAREIYWNSIWQILGSQGIDAWWCDSTEPVVADWGGKVRPADADAVNIAGLAKIIDPQLINAYALEDSTGIYENSRKLSPGRRVLNLTRSGYAGGQRTGSVLWTGDISARWDTLSQQIVALQSISAAGYPYITFDIGAFFVKDGSQWFWKGVYTKGADDLGYRELYTRWLQVGAFLPMFRSHGTDTPREPWRFGEPGTPFYDAIIGAINLRYQLLPFFYSVAGNVSLNGAPFLSPLAFSFPEDVKAHDLKSQFIVGDAFMAAPVIAPQEYGPDSTPITGVARTREVYLPKGASWFDFWNGRHLSGGQTIQADAPILHMPLYVKAGSIVPMGPRLQFTDEKPDAPVELRIYPGANGAFTYYEDEGDGYGYQNGAFATISLKWSDRDKTLTIGARKGKFPGMKMKREFHVVFVSENHGAGMDLMEKPDAIIRYKGEVETVRGR